MKKLALFLALVLTLSACTPTTPVLDNNTAQFTTNGFTLSIPNEYVDLLIVGTSHAESSGTFFSVHEKASVEAAQQMWPDDPTIGGGFLFSIACIDENTFHQSMMSGMTGMDVFARDNEGNYYVYNHPTDVQLLRVGDYTDADWEQWSELCEWANDIKATFLFDNAALNPYERTYSDVDCALHYIAYGDGTARLHYNDGDAVYTPERAASMPYLEQLLDDVMFYSMESGEYPEGRYITLTAPEMFDHISFDFFTDEGQQHIIRQNYHFDDTTALEPVYYVASKDGDFFPAGSIVADWLESLA